MREETFCLSDTVVVLDELQEQGLRAGAVCFLKYTGICPATLPENVKVSHRWWSPLNCHHTTTVRLQHILIVYNAQYSESRHGRAFVENLENVFIC